MSVQIENCRDLVFYFNKASLADATIPCWVIKTRGITYYVNHVDANVPWSTKETPEGSTKGSIKFKNVRLEIDEQNNARLSNGSS